MKISADCVYHKLSSIIWLISPAWLQSDGVLVEITAIILVLETMVLLLYDLA